MPKSYNAQGDLIVEGGGGDGGPHTHPIDDVVDLQDELDAKADAAATTTALAGKSNTGHTHAQADVTNLVTDLAAKAPTARSIGTTAPLTGGGDLSANRTLAISDATTSAKGAVELATDGENAAGVVVQGNDSRLSDPRAPTSHSHPQSEVTNLVTDLAGKAAADDARLSDARTPTGIASGDLAGSYPEPTVSGVLGYAVPDPATDGFLKWNYDFTTLETVTYGESRNTVMEGSQAERIEKLERLVRLLVLALAEEDFTLDEELIEELEQIENT